MSGVLAFAVRAIACDSIKIRILVLRTYPKASTQARSLPVVVLLTVVLAPHAQLHRTRLEQPLLEQRGVEVVARAKLLNAHDAVVCLSLEKHHNARQHLDAQLVYKKRRILSHQGGEQPEAQFRTRARLAASRLCRSRAAGVAGVALAHGF